MVKKIDFFLSIYKSDWKSKFEAIIKNHKQKLNHVPSDLN